MRCYVSGPISNGGHATDDEMRANLAQMAAAVAALRAEGHEVVSPAELHGEDPLAPEGLSWQEYMRADLRALLDCDSIVLLPGWATSRGARLERDVAYALGLDAVAYGPAEPVGQVTA
jgi:hypothetical protein